MNNSDSPTYLTQRHFGHATKHNCLENKTIPVTLSDSSKRGKPKNNVVKKTSQTGRKWTSKGYCEQETTEINGKAQFIVWAEQGQLCSQSGQSKDDWVHSMGRARKDENKTKQKHISMYVFPF